MGSLFVRGNRLNLSSALLKQVIDEQDFETWSQLRQHYLPSEYHKLYSIINKHSETYHALPTFQELEFAIRDRDTKEKLLAISSIEIDVEASMLLEYLKNEYVQTETFSMLETYIDKSIAFETASETVAHLHEIVMELEEKVDLQDPQESMQKIPLFPSSEEVDNFLPLGLNSDYDQVFKFSPRDLILVGGRRGDGKSITCANIANNVFDSGKSAIYFTIEMDSQQILQRLCSIATGVSQNRLRQRSLSVVEWERVAQWWASRFEGGEDVYTQYLANRDFDEFHETLKKNPLHKEKQLDIIYDPSLTLPKIRSELDKRMKSSMDVGVIIVDYINQVKRSSAPARGVGQYDWTEQIEVSKALKSMAQEYECPVFSPYQIDSTGEARFAKGILDAADAAFTIDSWSKEDACMTFNCVKMRSADMISFTSTMDWDTLRIGPEPALSPKERDAGGESSEDEIVI